MTKAEWRTFWKKLNKEQKVGLILLPFIILGLVIGLILTQYSTSVQADAAPICREKCQVTCSTLENPQQQTRCISICNNQCLQTPPVDVCETCQDLCDKYSYIPLLSNKCLRKCSAKHCPKPTPAPTPKPTPRPIPLPTIIPFPTPTPPIDLPSCGNGVCDPGEADYQDCPVCEPGDKVCPLRPCYFKPGTCPQDCQPSDQLSDVEKCHQANGTWKRFGNSCADLCLNYTNNYRIACLDVITESCDCGTDKCWTGSSCIQNPDHPLPSIKPLPPIIN